MIINGSLKTKAPVRASAAGRLQQWSLASQPETTQASSEQLTTSGGLQRLQGLAALSGRLMGNRVERVDTHATPERLEPANSLGKAAPSKKQVKAVNNSLKKGKAQYFPSTDRGKVAFQMSRRENQPGYKNYNLWVGRERVDIQITEGADQDHALGLITDYFIRQPEHLRGAVDEIIVRAGDNPDDDHWEKKYNIENFRSAAAGGGGRILFFGGNRNIRQDTFDHEFGHNVGHAVRRQQNREASRKGQLEASKKRDKQTGDDYSANIPRGWSEAAGADNNSVTKYGDTSISEDFAEFYEEYREAFTKGKKPFERFRAKHPNRSNFVESEVFTRRLDTAN